MRLLMKSFTSIQPHWKSKQLRKAKLTRTPPSAVTAYTVTTGSRFSQSRKLTNYSAIQIVHISRMIEYTI